MIVYFDTSALLKLVLPDEAAGSVQTLWDDADRVASSHLTYPESRAGLWRARRIGRLDSVSFGKAKRTLDLLFAELHKVDPTGPVCRQAGDLAERHALRGYDAVHLASALTLGVAITVLATWDISLRRAALVEGVSAPL